MSQSASSISKGLAVLAISFIFALTLSIAYGWNGIVAGVIFYFSAQVLNFFFFKENR